MNNLRIIFFVTIGLTASFAAFLLYIVLQERHERQALQAVALQLQDQALQNKVATNAVPAERVVTKLEAWRPIQEQVRDTVVQVFSQCAEVDMRQPYKTPSQYQASGSGFFINHDGDLITNAHVVVHAKAVWIQNPSLGKMLLDAQVLCIAPERDLALLRISPDSVDLLRQKLGEIPCLQLGNSDSVHRADEVMALGYPLSQNSLKSTTGVISGREANLIQMSAAINLGNSGGPLLNLSGEVVGINTAYVVDAQNVGYIIPINDLKVVLADMYKTKILHKPFLGVIYNNATEAAAAYLGNPQPSGCYIVEVVQSSVLSKAGVERGDMIYEFNGHQVDMYGEMNVPWSEDKISIADYMARLSIGDQINMVIYRHGTRKEVKITLSQSKQPAIRKVFPAYEEIDYEIIGGMVIMELTINHIAQLVKHAPALTQYAELKYQQEPVLIITHVFPTSYLARTRIVAEGGTINEVNGQKVTDLSSLRGVLGESIKTGYLTLRLSDNIARVSDNIFIVLPFDRILSEEAQLAGDYRYQLTASTRQLQMAWQENHPQKGYLNDKKALFA